VNNCLSEERKIYKGVPQGSVLSPLLFNVMLSDIPNPENGCEISLFADDIAIYCTTKTKEAAKRPLQRQLNRIEQWANKWKLKFSVDKCATLTSSRRKGVKTPRFNSN
jgi:retron-type reverse transcriptase